MEKLNSNNIAFAAMNDGTFFTTFNKDDASTHLAFLHLFQAIKNFIRVMDKQTTASFALAFLVEGKDISNELSKHMDQVKDAKEE